MNEQDPYGQQQPQPQPEQPQPQQPPGQQGWPPPAQPGWQQPAPQGWQPGNQQQGFSPQAYGPPQPPKHPQAQTAMILGIIALGGGATCLLPILVSPFAWYYGAKTKREIAAEPGRWSGQGDAQAGFVMGIIGTVGIILGVVALTAIIVLAVAFADSSTSSY